MIVGKHETGKMLDNLQTNFEQVLKDNLGRIFYCFNNCQENTVAPSDKLKNKIIFKTIDSFV